MSIRDYDKARMQRIGLALYAAMLRECTDESGVCFLPVEEVFDAMAMLGGIMLSTGPAANSNTKLRELTSEFGKKVMRRAIEAKNSGAERLFDVVLDETSTFQ